MIVVLGNSIKQELAQPAGPKLGSNGRNANGHNGRNSQTGQDNRQRQRHLDAPPDFPATHAHAPRSLNHRAVYGTKPGDNVTHKDYLGIDSQRDNDRRFVKPKDGH